MTVALTSINNGRISDCHPGYLGGQQWSDLLCGYPGVTI